MEIPVRVLNGSSLFLQNGSSFSDVYELPDYLFIIVAVLNAMIFVIGLFGNSLVVVVLLRKGIYLDSTDTFLLNLACADVLILAVCQPAALVEFYSKDVWHLGDFICRLVTFVGNMLSGGSVLIIIAISTERFYAICYPLKAKEKCTKYKTVIIILSLWILSACVSAPFFSMSFVQDADFYDGSVVPVCRTAIDVLWKKCFIVFISCVFYAFPLVLLVSMYAMIIRSFCAAISEFTVTSAEERRVFAAWRSKKQVVCMLIIVIIVFFTCLVPFRTWGLWIVFSDAVDVKRLGHLSSTWIMWSTRLLFYINSALNPVIYNLMSTRFRKAFYRTLRNCPSNGTSDQRATQGNSFSTYFGMRNQTVQIRQHVSARDNFY